MKDTAKLAALLFTVAVIAGFTPASFAQTETILDNGSAGFSTIGTWPVSTAVGGYYGANYQTHAPNGPPPSAVTVDNVDPGFSVTGTWPTSTAIPGYLGTNYRVHAPNGESPSAIVVDNSQGIATGTWSSSTAVAGYYGANYQLHAAGTGANTFTWSMSIPSTASYRVYARWTQHSNRATNAKYTVNHASGADVVTVSQETGGGVWNLLGTYTLNAGIATVVLSDDANENVIADAVMVVPEGAAPNTATWTIPVPSTGSYQVFARWTQHPNRATNAAYTVNHASGSTVVTVNQEAGGAAWALLGTFTLNAGQTSVSLTDQADGYVIADAVMIVPPGASPNTATWTPNVAQAGTYQVYARWTSNPNRATDAKYTVVHAAGASAVTVNQQANGGVWNLLGSYVLQPGTAHKVSLTDQANGFVIADAIRLVSANAAPAVAITSPANNAVVSAPANVTLTASASDADGSITKVDFYRGATLIGTATSAPYSVTATGLAAGSYSFTAVATDNQGAANTSTAINVVVNALPAVSITSPVSNAVFNAPANFTITANASDTDGAITKVDFYRGATLVGTATTAPYSVSLSGLAAGTYSLTAVATDDRGATTTSTVVSIRVNALPAVSLTSPTSGAVFNAPASITLTASASDADGSIQKVEFYQGATLVGTVTAGPYTVTLTNIPAGSYSYTAVATDNDNAQTTSAAVAVTVNTLPTVAITSPANNATFNAPATVAVTINAQDTDGTIQRVELYANSSLIATLTTAPYNFNWTNVGVGTYSLTAKAIDNNNSETVSAAVSITVRSVSTLFFIHVDHLNTPRLIADANQTTVWKWEHAEPFGDTVPDEAPDSGTVVFEFPLRFPGQYFDKDTNLAYNVMRDYDSRVGRYTQSDPIGLAGGINPYAYAGANPLWAIDEFGLKLCLVLSSWHRKGLFG